MPASQQSTLLAHLTEVKLRQLGVQEADAEVARQTHADERRITSSVAHGLQQQQQQGGGAEAQGAAGAAAAAARPGKRAGAGSTAHGNQAKKRARMLGLDGLASDSDSDLNTDVDAAERDGPSSQELSGHATGSAGACKHASPGAARDACTLPAIGAGIAMRSSQAPDGLQAQAVTADDAAQARAAAVAMHSIEGANRLQARAAPADTTAHDHAAAPAPEKVIS